MMTALLTTSEPMKGQTAPLRAVRLTTTEMRKPWQWGLLPLIRYSLLWLCLLATPAQANDMANLMRGMFTGLALLGQAGNSSQLGAPLTPWGMPLGSPPPMTPWGPSPWAGGPWGSTPWSSAPWGAAPGGWSPGQNTVPGAARPGWQHPAQSSSSQTHLMRLLQGSWQTQTGGLLLVKGNLARLYVSRDRYQDLEITADRQYVWMRPAGSRAEPDRYEHRIFDRRVILRDQDKRILVLTRHQADK